MEKSFQVAAESLSLNVKRLRERKRLAQERLGFESGVDRTVVSKIERRVANPTLDVLVRLAIALDVEVGDLLKTVGTKTK
jgi:transcriptional regulator with XRE-family HTH domain